MTIAANVWSDRSVPGAIADPNDRVSDIAGTPILHHASYGEADILT
ncbi:hypothetical protein [Oceaniovalibus sp. ACAM 378]|nr:hypothetical protein [Oceaniovalibus sp. ACAM 378]